MSSTDLATVQAGYAAFARGDVPAVLATFDPAITWYTPESVPGGGTFHGPADVAANFFAHLPERWDGLHIEAEQWLEAGDRIVMLGRLQGTGRATGTRIDSPCAHVWTLRDGLVVAFAEYLDSAVLAAAFGATVAAAV